jgi:uncharacterized protein with HEPN domain
MSKSAAILVGHILESISDIESFLEGVQKEQFLASKEKQAAVIRTLEVIGEAVKGLPAEFTQNHPGIPWRDIAGMRDNLIHEYFAVDLEEVWKTITKDLPELKTQLLAMPMNR